MEHFNPILGNDVKSLDNLTEGSVSTVQMRRCLMHDKEL